MDGEVRFLPYKEVQRRVGKARSWIRLQWLRGQFPEPLQIGRSTMFIEAEVTEWQAKHITARIRSQQIRA
jgi:predicted DNA-binding transcriptional regulator AlpA